MDLHPQKRKNIYPYYCNQLFIFLVQTVNCLDDYNISYMLFGTPPPQASFERIIRTNFPKIVMKQYICMYLLRTYGKVTNRHS